jgi:hypothetical protein
VQSPFKSFAKRMKSPSARLVHILIGKSIAETVVVGALAAISFITILPPYFHGWGEVTPKGIAGWAVNNAEPWGRVEVQLFIDGQFVSTQIAHASRPDVAAAGMAKDQWHGYWFSLDSLSVGTHEARIYAVHDSGAGSRKSLQLLGDPLKFSVDREGSLQGQ